MFCWFCSKLIWWQKNKHLWQKVKHYFHFVYCKDQKKYFCFLSSLSLRKQKSFWHSLLLWILLWLWHINPTFHGVWDSVAPMGGGHQRPPLIKEGVISDPILLYSIFYLVSLEITCKKSARNLKIWARLQDFKKMSKLRFCITLTNEKCT